ncbi:MAG: hypothetical protein MZV63_60100 [Marinilabiliales bacterium]|nr:hypothetical protein [Marinilabiliales bacterium]
MNRQSEGAQAAIDFLKQRNYIFRFVSNATRKCRKSVAHRLSAMGFDIPEECIFTPSIAAVAYIEKRGKQQCHLLATGDVDRDFTATGKREPGATIDCVVIGDAGDETTYNSLNAAFRYLIEGAER